MIPLRVRAAFHPRRIKWSAIHPPSGWHKPKTIMSGAAERPALKREMADIDRVARQPGQQQIPEIIETKAQQHAEQITVAQQGRQIAQIRPRCCATVLDTGARICWRHQTGNHTKAVKPTSAKSRQP